LVGQGEAAVRALYERRQGAYAAVERQVDTEGKTPEAVAEEIERRFLHPEGAP
jgi:hypothetical protein